MNKYIEIGKGIELPGGDIIQMVAVNKAAFYSFVERDLIASELNKEMKCEGCSLHFLADDLGDPIIYSEDYILANVLYLWG